MSIIATNPYAGSVSKSLIYDLKRGSGFQWSPFMFTEVMVDQKPRFLINASHGGNPIQSRISNPTATDFEGNPTVTFDGRSLSVTELSVMDTISPAQWKEYFPEYQPTGNNIDLKVNPKIWNVIYDLTVNAMQEQMNNLHSAGDTSLTSDPLEFYDGISTLALADSDCTNVPSPAPDKNLFTVDSIMERVDTLITSLPSRLQTSKSLTIFASLATYQMYHQAYKNSGGNVLLLQDINMPNAIKTAIGSARIVWIDGFPNDMLLATIADSSQKSNLVQGIWTSSDEAALKLDKISNLDDDFRFKLSFDMGVQYRTGKDIFYTLSTPNV